MYFISSKSVSLIDPFPGSKLGKRKSSCLYLFEIHVPIYYFKRGVIDGRTNYLRACVFGTVVADTKIEIIKTVLLWKFRGVVWWWLQPGGLLLAWGLK